MADQPRRRAPHDIMIEISKSGKDGERKTRIMYKVGLSHSQLGRYLDALKEAGFLAEESGVWRTTEKGLHVIEACEICLRLTREV